MVNVVNYPAITIVLIENNIVVRRFRVYGQIVGVALEMILLDRYILSPAVLFKPPNHAAIVPHHAILMEFEMELWMASVKPH